DADAPYQLVNLTMELARALKPGDIIENSYYMFWHPYLVESILSSLESDSSEDSPPVTVRVIHYGRRDLFEAISVLQENITLDSTNTANGHFRLYRFNLADCRPDEETVKLARDRIGETDHRMLSNNATYFALSCRLTDEAFDRCKRNIGRFRVVNPIG
ncbi:hypothetical protein BOX15_Mlig031332g1, partial [Macrostomum lignano]